MTKRTQQSEVRCCFVNCKEAKYTDKIVRNPSLSTNCTYLRTVVRSKLRFIPLHNFTIRPKTTIAEGHEFYLNNTNSAELPIFFPGTGPEQKSEALVSPLVLSPLREVSSEQSFPFLSIMWGSRMRQTPKSNPPNSYTSWVSLITHLVCYARSCGNIWILSRILTFR